jgi:hypothetical protein
MSDISEILSSGEIARLIPVIADSRKEQRVTSVFLATLSAVPRLSQALFETIGERLSKRSVVETYTEVVLKGDENGNDRPDGLFRVTRGGKTWSALVEAKIGNSELNSQQVQRYLQLARTHDLDAVITISNQFVARPDHSPLIISKSLTNRIDLFHWSWKFILTEAILQQTQGLIEDSEQAFILKEFIRFLSHDSVGVTGFNQMPPEWKTVVDLVKSGGTPRHTSPETESCAAAWHQETRDIALRMSRHLAAKCTLKLSKAHAKNSAQKLKDDASELSEKKLLTAEYLIPNAASALKITVDLKAQTIAVGMRVDAPKDKQRSLSRTNWILRQLKHAEADNIYVRIIWASRTPDMVCSLDDLKNQTKTLLQGTTALPRAFEIYALSGNSRRFSGRKIFIEDLELMVPKFYDEIGQHLKQWQPKPPQPVKEIEQEFVEQAAPISNFSDAEETLKSSENYVAITEN